MDLADDAVYAALDAVVANGGDPTQPTLVTDTNTMQPVAVVQQLANGSISIQPASSLSIGGIVQSVTGFLNDSSGFLTGISVELKKVSNAVQGGAVGAQSGYNAPTDWKPYLYAGGAVIGLLLISRRR